MSKRLFPLYLCFLGSKSPESFPRPVADSGAASSAACVASPHMLRIPALPDRPASCSGAQTRPANSPIRLATSRPDTFHPTTGVSLVGSLCFAEPGASDEPLGLHAALSAGRGLQPPSARTAEHTAGPIELDAAVEAAKVRPTHRAAAEMDILRRWWRCCPYSPGAG